MWPGFHRAPISFLIMVQKTKKAYHLVRAINESLTNNKTVCSNQSVLLALSGGQDSICLLLIVLQLKNQWDWKLSILCCNHLWQKDSFFTTTHVFKVAFLLHIPLCFGSALQMVFSEQEARKWRSLIFQRIYSFYKHDLLFTGHSNSDRTETSLFNLFRGAGLQGVLPLYWNKLNSLKTFLRSQDSCFKGWALEQTSSLSKKESKNKQSLYSLTRCDSSLFFTQTNSFLRKKKMHVGLLPLKVLFWTTDQTQSQHFWMLRKGLHSTKAILLSLTTPTNKVDPVSLTARPLDLFLVKHSVLGLFLTKQSTPIHPVDLFLNKAPLPCLSVLLLSGRINKGNCNGSKETVCFSRSKSNRQKCFFLVLKEHFCLKKNLKGLRKSVFISRSVNVGAGDKQHQHQHFLSKEFFFTLVVRRKEANTRVFFLTKKTLSLDPFYVDTNTPTSLNSCDGKRDKLPAGKRFNQRTESLVTFKSRVPKKRNPEKKQEPTPFTGGLALFYRETTSHRKGLSRQTFSWHDNQKTEGHKQGFQNKTNLDVNILTIFPSLKTKKQVKRRIKSVTIPVNLESSKRNAEGLFVCNSLIARKPPSTCKSLFLFSTKNVVSCKGNLFWLIGRPLLCLNRFEITNLSQLWRLPLHPDQTNQNLQTSRNKMRKQMLPLLRLFFNPQIESSLSQFSEIVFQEEQYLSFLTKRVSNKVLQSIRSNKKLGREVFVFNTSLFMGLPTIFKRRVVKLFLERVTTQKVTFPRISKVIHIIEKHDP